MRVLIVDDDRSSRLVLRHVLTSRGHDVVEAEDGNRALLLQESDPFPVVISDWMMPVLSGPELCRSIRRGEARRVSRGEARRYTYVLLLTALEGRASYLEGLEAGADDFMSKPLDRELLVARLHVAQRVLGLEETVERLHGLLPICAYCKKIREGSAEGPPGSSAWSAVETYVARHSQASFTHSVCPECFRTQVQPQLDALRQGEAPAP